MIDPRDHITDSLTREKAKLEFRRSLVPLGVIAVGIVIGFVCWAVIARNVGQHLYRPTQKISFKLPADSAQGIVAGRQEVRFKGIPAGIISKMDKTGPQPVITVKMYKTYGTVYNDARAIVRPNTALEDTYVDILDRGHRSAGVATKDKPLASNQIRGSVQPEDVLKAVDPDVRDHLATVMRNLGGGLQDRGASLRAAFQELYPFLQTADRLSTQFAVRQRLTKRLVTSTSVLTKELGSREIELRKLVREGGATVDTLANKSPQLDATLHELPPTLSAVHTSFASVRGVLPDLDGALRALRPTAVQLPEGLSALRSFSRRANPAVEALRTPVKRLVPLSQQLRPLSANLNTAVGELRPQIPQLRHVSNDVTKCPQIIQAFFQWTPSTIKFGDERGAVIRGDGVIGGESGGLEADPQVHALPSCVPGGPIGGTPGHGGDLKP